MKAGSFALLALLGIILFTPISSALAQCKVETKAEQLLQASVDGEKAFAQMDLTALLMHARVARDDIITCIKEPITPKQAAAFHRLMALEAFTRHNYKRVESEFHAARMLEPGYAIPADVADGDHPLLTHYEDAAMSPDGEPESIYAPAQGHVFIGGVRNAPWRKLTPAVIQVYASEVETSWIETRYVQPGETLPVWGRNVFGMTAKDLGIDTQPSWQKPMPWYISAGVSAVIAGVFYGLAMNEKSQFDDSSTPDNELAGHRDRANGFGLTSVATAGLALALTGIGIGFDFGFESLDEPTVSPVFSTPRSSDHPFASGAFP